MTSLIMQMTEKNYIIFDWLIDFISTYFTIQLQ